ncbi:MAG TPA: hypothetical protein VHX38_02120 [Pseudonocardiaceae bacterium]|nr:hypothetical protein [Pseudonocardiaceae bacterium]
MADVKRCKTPFATTIDGMIRVVSAGQIVSTSDPAYTKGTAEHFEDVDVYVAGQESKRRQAAGVEEATSVPGEKRSVRGGSRGKAGDAVPDADSGDPPAADSKDTSKP